MLDIDREILVKQFVYAAGSSHSYHTPHTLLQSFAKQLEKYHVHSPASFGQDPAGLW
jgi:hypothetical protein